MFKKVCIVIVIALIMNITLIPVWAVPSGEGDELDSGAITAAAKPVKDTNVFDLKAKASVLMDATTGSVLLERNSQEKLPLASVTKIMSMLLVMEALDSGKITYEDRVQVTEHSYNMGGSQVYLKPGEEFTVLEMLKAVAIHSANDATVALAEKISGSEDAFVTMMNNKAKELGMNNTNFIDCTGLTDDGHYSSAHDIALMSKELIIKHPKILDITTIWHDTFRNGQFSLDNTNKLIKQYPGANGLKTGFTTKAGYCLSAAAKKNDMQLIAVVLGEPDTNTRFSETKKLLDYGFANFEIAGVNKKGEEVGSVEVKKGVDMKVAGQYADDIKLLLKKGEKNQIVREVKFNESLTAPIAQGQKVGEVIFKLDGKEVGKANIAAAKEIKKASFARLFFRMFTGWFGIGRG